MEQGYLTRSALRAFLWPMRTRDDLDFKIPVENGSHALDRFSVGMKRIHLLLASQPRGLKESIAHPSAVRNAAVFSENG
jgi:hypothetical protein